MIRYCLLLLMQIIVMFGCNVMIYYTYVIGQGYEEYRNITIYIFK